MELKKALNKIDPDFKIRSEWLIIAGIWARDLHIVDELIMLGYPVNIEMEDVYYQEDNTFNLSYCAL